MKFQYHILTPFSRYHNLGKIIHMLRPLGISWHPLIEDEYRYGICGKWIDTFYFTKTPEGWHPAHWALNQFIERAIIHDDHRYLILPDDDFYDDGFFDKVDAVDGDLLVISMRRPVHGDLLEAKPDNFRGAAVGGEQVIAAGKIFRQGSFSPPYGGDWEFIEKLGKASPPVFVPEAVINFNAL